MNKVSGWGGVRGWKGLGGLMSHDSREGGKSKGGGGKKKAKNEDGREIKLCRQKKWEGVAKYI